MALQNFVEPFLLLAGNLKEISPGYWHPCCRLELVETGEIVHRFMNAEAALCARADPIATKVELKVSLSTTFSFDEKQILEVICTCACSREAA